MRAALRVAPLALALVALLPLLALALRRDIRDFPNPAAQADGCRAGDALLSYL